MSQFYETAFGWQTEQLGKEMGDYVPVTTTERDEKTGLSKRPGAYSIAVACREVLGERVPGKPDDIPGVGLDTEGKHVSMIESPLAIEVGGIKLKKNDYEKTYDNYQTKNHTESMV